MFIILRDEKGRLGLVNLSQAQYIRPLAKDEKLGPGIEITWQHEAQSDHEIPDHEDQHSWTDSIQKWYGASINTINELMIQKGLAFSPVASTPKPEQNEEIKETTSEAPAEKQEEDTKVEPDVDEPKPPTKK